MKYGLISVWLDNVKATEARLHVADECLEDLIQWLQTGGGQVAIFDGNNVTESRRKQIHDKLLDNKIHVGRELNYFLGIVLTRLDSLYSWNSFVINRILFSLIFEASRFHHQT